MMKIRRATFSLILSVAVGGSVWAGTAERPATASSEAVAPLTTKERATTATSALRPRFDIWADQPRLGCSLPAIRSWKVVRNVHAQADLPQGTEFRVGLPQVIFAQRPPENPGLTKYSVIYQAARLVVGDSDMWRGTAESFHQAFVESVRKGGQFLEIEVSSPTITAGSGRQRFSFTYHLETKTSQTVDGGVFGVPAYHGVLFYTLALEGQRPQAAATALDELGAAAIKGLAMRTWSATPYVVGVLLAMPILVIGAWVYKRRRLGL